MLVGTPPPGREELASEDLRDIALRHGRPALADVHGTWLIAIISGPLSPTDKFFNDLLTAFSSGPVVIGPTAPMLTAAYHSASEAISGMNAVAGWSGARDRCWRANCCRSGPCSGTPRPSPPCTPRSCAPRRRGSALTETLDAYLDSGGAIEACARKLFVHPNTVRYRLKRITDFTGRDPTLPRDAYVLRVAATVGRLEYPAPPQTMANGTANPSPRPWSARPARIRPSSR